MELSSEQKDYIESFIEVAVQRNLKLWMSEHPGYQLDIEREMEIRERIIHVEESLDKHIALTKQGFEQMDKRFELLTGQMDKRFELLTGQMDKRFEQMDKRFEQINHRFTQMFAYLTTGILILGVLITAFGILG